jgi:hypothetical protein
MLASEATTRDAYGFYLTITVGNEEGKEENIKGYNTMSNDH